MSCIPFNGSLICTALMTSFHSRKHKKNLDNVNKHQAYNEYTL